MNKQDTRIYQIRQVLLANDGAKEVKEIIEQLTQICVFTNEDVINGDLARIRHMWNVNEDHYGFTIPHVMRGPNAIGDRRFFVEDKENTGFRFKDGDERYDSINNGFDATMKEASTKLRHAAACYYLGSRSVFRQSRYEYYVEIHREASNKL